MLGPEIDSAARADRAILQTFFEAHFTLARSSIHCKGMHWSLSNMLILFESRHMVEPLACGVFNTVLPRHVAFVQSSSLKRVVNGTRRPSLAANFFIPMSRSDKGKEKAMDVPSIEEVLGCQSWATPPSKKEVWDQGVCYLDS